MLRGEPFRVRFCGRRCFINGLLRETDHTRIGLGIRWPESREPDVVAEYYVLRKINTQERMKIEGGVWGNER